MNLFFSTQIQNELVILPADEARHVVQVLRLGKGAPVTIVDGAGGWYEGSIVEARKNRCVVRITHREERIVNPGYTLHLGIAPTKNINRFEWFLEKATEIGINEITPLLCFHSERRRLRPERLQKVLVAAMKQSLKAELPELNELTKFDDFMKKCDARDECRFIAHLGADTKGALKDNYLPGQSVTILIGPEGDFSHKEIQLAQRHQFTPVTLGASRLRTETAGVVAVHTIQLMNS